MMTQNLPTIGLLRFTTAGSVDDGKSTLIGRLLYDSKSIYEDQLESITTTSLRKGNEAVDLSLLTDGLRAEREQGITIDVAYRYFSTPLRKFIIADTPGHIQYTRNMVTGASTADVAVILIDARKGVLEQTIRHAYIAALLNMKHVIFCVNKMDLKAYAQSVFDTIKKDLEKLAERLLLKSVHTIPISAKYGDNVVRASAKMTWYKHSPLLKVLETLRIAYDYSKPHMRFPVQYVLRADNDLHRDYRAYAGTIAGGRICQGQKVTVLPQNLNTHIKRIEVFGQKVDEAKSGDAVAIILQDDLDVSRGDMIVPAANLPEVSKEFKATICWFNAAPLDTEKRYVFRQNTREMKCFVKTVNYKLNINTLDENYTDKCIEMNAIAEVTIKTAQPAFIDDYNTNPSTGSFIIIDEETNETLAAGMIRK